MNITRHQILRHVTILLAALAATSCMPAARSVAEPSGEEVQTVKTKLQAIPMSEKVKITNDEWRKVLTPEQYHVLREAGTEPAFHNKYWNNHEKGTFVCAACGNPLFSSETKYESGTGWPSFFQPIKKDAVESANDTSHGMVRDEVRCARCGSHLGHVFDDGPQPTGLRYCMNSASLKLEKKDEK
jgi:peptide-methionine (R)-S-oxide reductase